jgi:EAL domain-containing protein (putative c-di-GMP-specific phosphodiesterase class I)
VRSILALARSFGLSTTAEGVETREQCELLAGLGVDHAQGFFFSPAVELEALTRLDTIAL